MFSHFKIAAKLMLVIGLLIGMIGGLGCLSFVSVNALHDSIDAVIQNKDAETGAEELVSGLYKVRTYAWIGISTNDKAKWDRAFTEAGKTEAIIQKLKKEAPQDRLQYLGAAEEAFSSYQANLRRMQAAQESGQTIKDPSLQMIVSELGQNSAILESSCSELSRISEIKTKGVTTEAQASAENIIFWIQLISALAVFLGAVLWLLIKGMLATPIEEIANVMRQLAADNLHIKIPSLDRKDEIGDMARAVESFRATTLEIRKLQDTEHDHTIEANKQRKAMLKKMADQFEESVMGIASVVSSSSEELHASAGSVVRPLFNRRTRPPPSAKR